MDLTVESILGPEGLIAQNLTGYETRSDQLEMAREVDSALGDGEHLLAEAGTGVGKTLGYIGLAGHATTGEMRQEHEEQLTLAATVIRAQLQSTIDSLDTLLGGAE